MKQVYTEESFIRFYYGECDIFFFLEIENELETNVQANHHYSEFYSDILDKMVTLSPKQSSLDKIMAHARS